MGGQRGWSSADPTADDCVAAGLYWYSQRDLEAAEAWWRRALELEPRNRKVRQCLDRLFEHRQSGSLPTPGEIPFSTQRDPSSPPLTRKRVTQRIAAPEDADPFAFAAEAGDAQIKSGQTAVLGDSPWDEGPSRTSSVTLSDDQAFDAVAVPTPLPELDRSQFFNRVVDDAAYLEYIVATSDLPPKEISVPIQIDAPVEIDTSSRGNRNGRSNGHTQRDTEQGRLDEAVRRYQLHDFGGALELLERLPLDNPEMLDARNLAAQAHRNLLKMYESKIGDFEGIPHVLITGEEMIWLNLNHRAGFILSQIDGTVSYEDLIALSGMPRLDTVRVLSELLSQGVIATRF